MFFGPPTFGDFYADILNCIEDQGAESPSCLVRNHNICQYGAVLM